MQTQELIRLVGFGGALVGLIFVGFVWLIFVAFDRWMGFQIQTANHRSRLYAEQLKLYRELVALMFQAAADAQSAPARGQSRGTEALQYGPTKLSASQVAFYQHMRQSAYLLPDAILRAAEDVHEAMGATAAPGSPLDLDLLHRAVLQAIRVCVGVDALTEGTLKRIGPRQSPGTVTEPKASREAAA